MREHDPVIGTFFTARNMLFGVLAFCLVLLLAIPTSPAQAAFVAFFFAVLIFQYFISRDQLKGISIQRAHLPRVFEGDTVEVSLKLHATRELPVQMLQL